MATVLCGQSFNKTRLFQLGEAPVQRPRTELHACKAFDVLDEAIAMLWSTGQARENKDAAVRGPANAFHRHVDHPSLRLSNHDISESGVMQPAAQTEVSPAVVRRVSITFMATVAIAPSWDTTGIMAPPMVAAVSRNVTLNDDLTPDCASV